MPTPAGWQPNSSPGGNVPPPTNADGSLNFALMQPKSLTNPGGYDPATQGPGGAPRSPQSYAPGTAPTSVAAPGQQPMTATAGTLAPPMFNDTTGAPSTTTAITPGAAGLGGSYGGPGTVTYPGGLPVPPQAPSPPPVGSIPTIAPYNQPAVPTVTAPTATTFTGTAPAPITTGQFTAPDPTNFQTDPSYQWRLQQGEQALQGSAAARGTLLTGGTAEALQNYGQGAASQEYQNAYNRALGTYTTNRDTNAQNFGEATTQYTGDLSKFNANTSAALGYGGLAASDAAANFARQDQAAKEQQQYQQSILDRNATANNAVLGSNYEQQQARYQQQLEATAEENAAAAARQKQMEQDVLNRYSGTLRHAL